MAETAKTKLVKIGNSRGIRIPKALLDRLHLADDIEIVVREDHLEVRRGRKPREGWGERFARMAARGDDRLVEAPTATAWDNEEWEW